MVVRNVLAGMGQQGEWVGTFGPSGSGAYVRTPTSSLLSLGTTADLTIEWWMYSTAYSYLGWLGCPVCRQAGGSVVLRLDTAWNNPIASIPFSTRPAPALNVWTHFCISRSGSIGYVHINGVQYVNSVDSTDFNLSNSLIGNYNNTTEQEWCGYLSQFRISNNARYTYNSSFTPKTILSSDANTVFLTLNSPSFIDTGPNNLGSLTVNAGSNTPTMTSGNITGNTIG